LSDSCLIIHPVFKVRVPGRDQRDYVRDLETELNEIKGLASAISLEVLDVHIANIPKIAPGFLLGSGTREELAAKIAELSPSVVIVNFNLTPIQQRNLERDWKAKVIDRTGLILEIFGERAQTREGQIQVELAYLNYQRSRLVKSWTHLERQRGGTGKAGGPGETQLEIDRRIVDEKIVNLKKQLKQVSKNRDLQRESRERTPFPIVAIVGYTNAGKSTLFNRLTGADVFAENLHFATLDPTLRRLKLPGGQIVILSDTVGFIADLPTHLVAAFRATLEQVQYANVILHVRDIASPDTDAQKEDVINVLSDLGIDYATDKRVLEVLNKIDLAEEHHLHIHRDKDLRGRQAPVSAVTGEGLDALLSTIQDILNQTRVTRTLVLPVTAGKAMAWLHAHVAVSNRMDEDETVKMVVIMSQAEENKFRYLFPDIEWQD
jgi:GTP-binding protein HflX